MVPLIALASSVFASPQAGVAALYGGFTALAVTAVLVWRERQAMRHPEWDQHRLMKQFIRTGIERLAVLIALLGAGLGAMRLAPLPLLLGLVLAQLAWLAAATRRHTK